MSEQDGSGRHIGLSEHETTLGVAQELSGSSLTETTKRVEKNIPAPRPWIRLWARSIDYFLWAAIIYFPMVKAYSAGAIASNEYSLMKLYPLLIAFTWALVEPIVLVVFGTTIGKALLRVRLTRQSNDDLSKVDLSPLFRRSISVWLKGVGIGYLVATLITGLVSYRNLKSHGETSWNRDYGFTVTHGKVGYVGGSVATIISLVGMIFVLFWIFAQIAH